MQQLAQPWLLLSRLESKDTRARARSCLALASQGAREVYATAQRRALRQAKSLEQQDRDVLDQDSNKTRRCLLRTRNVRAATGFGRAQRIAGGPDSGPPANAPRGTGKMRCSMLARSRDRMLPKCRHVTGVASDRRGGVERPLQQRQAQSKSRKKNPKIKGCMPPNPIFSAEGVRI